MSLNMPINTLTEEEFENLCRNTITALFEANGFVPSGVISDGNTSFQKLQRGVREVAIGVVVLS